MTRFKDARDKGLVFLLSDVHADGSFGDPERGVRDYYKALLAFECGGHTRETGRLCDWIAAYGILPNGDFGPRAPGGEGYSYVYPNLWVIIGAHRIGRFDIVRRGMDYLRSIRDPKNGVLYSSTGDGTTDGRQDLLLVSFSGLAALYAGDMQMANDAARWLKTVMDAQPDFPRKLFTSFDPASGLITESTQDELRAVVIADTERDQLFFNPGAAAGFLALLHLATGRREWLDLAQEYMRLPEVASDYLFRLLRAGKVGWAAALLYTITKQTRYRDMAARVGDNLIALQQPDGSWKGAFGRMSPNESTAERVVWLDAIHQSVN